MNQGLRANHRVNQTTLRAVVAGEQVEAVAVWLQDGIAPETIVAAVRGVAEHWKPKGRDRQLWGLAYCDGAVRRLHEEARAVGAGAAFVEA
jgi:hypothetical protein